MHYAIRAELPSGNKYDFVVDARTRASAQEQAEQEIQRKLLPPTEQPYNFDWHGQVVFVNRLPAEDTVRRGRAYKLVDLFDPQSIKQTQVS